MKEDEEEQEEERVKGEVCVELSRFREEERAEEKEKLG